MADVEERLAEGCRIGRFVVLHDMDGRVHAVAAGSVAAVCETDEGSLLMLPGGKMVHVPQPLVAVLTWLDGRSPGSSALSCPACYLPLRHDAG